MAELKSIQVNGVDLAYVEAGTGEPVVLIHGLPNDYRVWGPQVAGLSGGYRVIAYSRRCAYPNKHDDGRDDGVAANADDLAALLESLPSKSAHLVGHSYGGFVALYCAYRHPELVRSMVLCEPAVTSLLTTNPRNPLSLISLILRDGEGARALLHFANSTARPAQRALKEGDALRASKLFVDGLGGPGAFEALSAEMQAMVLDNIRSSVRALDSAIPRFDRRDAATVKLPILLVGGANSQRYFSHIDRLLALSLPVCTQVVIPDAFHNVPLEKPQEFNKATSDFLDKG